MVKAHSGTNFMINNSCTNNNYVISKNTLRFDLISIVTKTIFIQNVYAYILPITNQSLRPVSN